MFINRGGMLRAVMVALCAGAALVGVSQEALAQAFPSKPIRFIVPFAPGGALDVLARPLALKLHEQLGQPVVVETRPGGATVVGAAYVAQQPPDGHIFMINAVGHYLTPLFVSNVPFDPVKDFTPIILVAATPNVVAVHPSVPASSLKELLEYAKKSPPVFYGTSGPGTTHHIGGIMLAQLTGLDFQHVNYRGGNQSVTDVLGGQIPMVILTAGNAMQYVRQGRLKAIAMIDGQRSPNYPEIPTIGETIPGYAVPDTWIGILGPAGIPANILKKLNEELHKALLAPEVRSRLESNGWEVRPGTAEEFAALALRDRDAFQRIVATAGIKPE